jgi:hypothetical protein
MKFFSIKTILQLIQNIINWIPFIGNPIPMIDEWYRWEVAKASFIYIWPNFDKFYLNNYISSSFT